jgi:hypothetical protein
MLEIQKVNDRTPIAREWLKYAREQQSRSQVFNAYFAAYIALVACSTQLVGDISGRTPSGDDDLWEGKAITEALQFKNRQIADFLETDKGKQIKGVVWQRVIPEGDKYRIIGPGNDPILTQAAQTLEKFFNPARQIILNDSEKIQQSTQMSVLFRKVRNRLFHGGKMYDPNGSDAELLQKLNPLLVETVEILLVH